MVLIINRLNKTAYPFMLAAGQAVLALPENPWRAYLAVVNQSASGAGNCWLNWGNAAALNQGFKVEAGNGIWEEDFGIGVSVQEIYLYNDGAGAIQVVVIEGVSLGWEKQLVNRG
jgi:hypothetical protein